MRNIAIFFLYDLKPHILIQFRPVFRLVQDAGRPQKSVGNGEVLSGIGEPLDVCSRTLLTQLMRPYTIIYKSQISMLNRLSIISLHLRIINKVSTINKGTD